VKLRNGGWASRGGVDGASFYVGAMRRGVIRCAVKKWDINQTNRPVCFHVLPMFGIILGFSTFGMLGTLNKQCSITTQKT
jgi:hypothetical protein